MKRNKAYRYRIYPNKAQEELLQKTFGCARFIWNQMLADLKDAGASQDIVRLLALRKLKEVYFARRVKKSIRRELDARIAKDLLPEEREWIRNASNPDGTNLPHKTQIFYRSLTGDFAQRAFFGVKFRFMELWDWFAERLYYRSSLFQEHEEERRWLRHVIREHEEIYGTICGKHNEKKEAE